MEVYSFLADRIILLMDELTFQRICYIQKKLENQYFKR